MNHDRSSKHTSAPRLPASLGAPRDHLYPRFSETDVGKMLRFGTLELSIWRMLEEEVRTARRQEEARS